MKNQILQFCAKFTVVFLFIALLMPLFAAAQEKDEKEKKRDEKQQKKETKQNEKDEKRVEKQVRKYEEALAKAVDKYGRDFEFKDNVDYEFRRLQREHAKRAFEINTLDSDDEAVTFAGDKIPTEDTLYDNLLAQDYVNRVGQSLVPEKSERRFGFKITSNPMPDARSLSTGTIYVSTGLLSLVDNEAQLAYILSHEIAHIERDHWKQDVLVAKWVEEATKSQEMKAGIIGAVGGGLLGAFGGKGLGNAVSGAYFGAGIAQFVVKLVDNKSFEWSLAQEDEADRLALNYMLNRNYDVRETQTFYETLKTAAIEDPRIELDRFADRERTEERRKAVSAVINSTDSSQLSKTLIGASNLRGKSLSMDRNTAVVLSRVQKNEAKMADDIKLKVQNGELIAGDGEFENIMATLKRDNGVSAFYYDMYKLAARNLSQSLAIRSDDATAYFFYGKVLKLTARKPGEKEQALQMFAKAIELDRRGTNPQARLYYALTKMSGRTTNNVQEVGSDLKQYVEMFQRMNAGALPPNMSIIYDYLQEAGDSNWTAVPVSNVRNVSASTTNVPPPVATPTQPVKPRKP
ncbi:MAG: M48 family metalloprotease [Pyrinomonadaceae bacterium]|nr:M48 family metalloprotease [Pyrinomonadaceae bacterium]